MHTSPTYTFTYHQHHRLTIMPSTPFQFQIIMIIIYIIRIMIAYHLNANQTHGHSKASGKLRVSSALFESQYVRVITNDSRDTQNLYLLQYESQNHRQVKPSPESLNMSQKIMYGWSHHMSQISLFKELKQKLRLICTCQTQLVCTPVEDRPAHSPP